MEIERCREENMRILREELIPLLDNILNAAPEEIESLEEFADVLMKNQLDNGLQYQICNALVAYARVKNDRELLIKELYLTAMAALNNDTVYDVGEYTEQSSKVQAACPWYPPTDVSSFPYETAEQAAASPESLLLGRNVMLYKEDAIKICPVTYVTNDAPPFMIIHGTNDCTVPFTQGELLHDRLEAAGCDVQLIAIEGANHADYQFFQRETWRRIIDFFHDKLGYAK